MSSNSNERTLIRKLQIKKKQLRMIKTLKKKQLAKEVEKYPCIWDTSHPDYKKIDFQLYSWTKISYKLNLSISECKTLWKLVGDLLRYKLRHRSVVDDDNGSESNKIDDHEDLKSWEYYDCLKYLINKKLSTPNDEKAERSTDLDSNNSLDRTNLDNDGDEDDGHNDDEEQEDDKSQLIIFDSDSDNDSESISSYAAKKIKNDDFVSSSRHNNNASTSSFSNHSSSSFAQKLQIESNNSSSIPSRSSELAYYSMFVNLDRMFKKLPESIVEDLNIKFQTQTYEELKKHTLPPPPHN